MENRKRRALDELPVTPTSDHPRRIIHDNRTEGDSTRPRLRRIKQEPQDDFESERMDRTCKQSDQASDDHHIKRDDDDDDDDNDDNSEKKDETYLFQRPDLEMEQIISEKGVVEKEEEEALGKAEQALEMEQEEEEAETGGNFKEEKECQMEEEMEKVKIVQDGVSYFDVTTKEEPGEHTTLLDPHTTTIVKKDRQQDDALGNNQSEEQSYSDEMQKKKLDSKDNSIHIQNDSPEHSETDEFGRDTDDEDNESVASHDMNESAKNPQNANNNTGTSDQQEEHAGTEDHPHNDSNKTRERGNITNSDENVGNSAGNKAAAEGRNQPALLQPPNPLFLTLMDATREHLNARKSALFLRSLKKLNDEFLTTAEEGEYANKTNRAAFCERDGIPMLFLALSIFNRSTAVIIAILDLLTGLLFDEMEDRTDLIKHLGAIPLCANLMTQFPRNIQVQSCAIGLLMNLTFRFYESFLQDMHTANVPSLVTAAMKKWPDDETLQYHATGLLYNFCYSLSSSTYYDPEERSAMLRKYLDGRGVQEAVQHALKAFGQRNEDIAHYATTILSCLPQEKKGK